MTLNTSPTAASVGFMQLWLIISALTQVVEVNQMLVVRRLTHLFCCLGAFLSLMKKGREYVFRGDFLLISVDTGHKTSCNSCRPV